MWAAPCCSREQPTFFDSRPRARCRKCSAPLDFTRSKSRPSNLPWTWPGDAEDVFDYVCAVAAPFRPMLERVRAEDWPAIRAEAKAAIERYRVGDEIRFGADVVLASGKA